MATTGHENESINVEGLKSSLQALKTKYVDSINSDISSLDSRTDTLEEAVGTGGSVDTRIANAKSEIIGGATSDGNTLKKLEDRVSPLETAIGSGGSIDTRIETAINALDSSASQNAGSDGLALSITETDGKITSISGSISSNVYAPASDSARITTLENSIVAETSRAQAAEQLLQEQYNALTQSDIVIGALPASGTKNKIYRVPGTSSYSDYMWDGTQFVLMAIYDNAIDDSAPSSEISNVISSRGVAKVIEEKEVNGSKFGIEDDHGNALMYIKDDNVLAIPVDIEIGCNNKISFITIPGFKFLITDAHSNIIYGITDSGKIIGNFPSIPPSTSFLENTIFFKKHITYLKNLDRINYITNSAIYPGNKRRFQALILSDSHDNTESFKNWIDAGNDIETVDALIHLGDLTNDGVSNEAVVGYLNNLAGKPVYITLGNHDQGYNLASRARTQKELHDIYVKPLVDRGYITLNEYNQDKCYYHHDFIEKNVRLIILYPFDEERTFDETYWSPIEYDPSYSIISKKSYTVGKKVNVENLSYHSFECVNPVTVTDNDKTTYPRYKTNTWLQWYSQGQLEWLCQKLDEAGGLGYTVIIAQHFIPFSGYTGVDCRFSSSPSLRPGRYFSRYGEGQVDPMYEVCRAGSTSGTVNFTVYPVPSSTYYSSFIVEDNVEDISPVSINYSFQNSVKITFMNGHNHADFVYRKDDFTGVEFMCSRLSDGGVNSSSKDIMRTSEDIDCFTSYTLSEDKIFLTRLGCSIRRKIDEENQTLSNKDCVIIDY